jgi:hypothetical protein
MVALATGSDPLFEDAAFGADKVKPRRPNDQQGFTFYGGAVNGNDKGIRFRHHARSVNGL